MFTPPANAPAATFVLPVKPAAPTLAVVLIVSPVEYPKNFKMDSIQSVTLPKLNKLKIKTQIIKTINIPDMIDQILYPDSDPDVVAASAAKSLIGSIAEEEGGFELNVFVSVFVSDDIPVSSIKASKYNVINVINIINYCILLYNYIFFIKLYTPYLF